MARIKALKRENDELYAQFRGTNANHITTLQPEQTKKTDIQDAHSTKVPRHLVFDNTPSWTTPKKKFNTQHSTNQPHHLTSVALVNLC
ncbi:hypothetical protein CR513_44472, partial [Mucuna pruriens]